MILEYLAAAGRSVSQQSFTVGDQESDQFPGSYEYGFVNNGMGSMFPGTVNGKVIDYLYTFEDTTFYFALVPPVAPQSFWERMEFERNGVIEKVVYSASAEYSPSVGSPISRSRWIINGVSWQPAFGETYTLRIYT